MDNYLSAAPSVRGIYRIALGGEGGGGHGCTGKLLLGKTITGGRVDAINMY
jgi:hypothetical protein